VGNWAVEDVIAVFTSQANGFSYSIKREAAQEITEDSTHGDADETRR
jgi:hypothetical protein